MPAVRSLYENDPDMAEIVGMFVCELPSRADLMNAALQQGNLAELRSLAHQLKGAGGGYGFPQITELAGALEQALIDEASEPEIKERLTDLCQLLAAVEAPESS